MRLALLLRDEVHRKPRTAGGCGLKTGNTDYLKRNISIKEIASNGKKYIYMYVYISTFLFPPGIFALEKLTVT